MSIQRKGLAATLALTMAFIPVLPATGSVDVQTHSSVIGSDYVKSESAMTPSMEGRGSTVFGAEYNYSHDPLVRLTPDRDQRLETLVEGIQSFAFFGGRDLTRFFSVNAVIPVHSVYMNSGLQEFSLGDIRLLSKLSTFHSPSGISMALIPELRLPSGRTDLFVSSGTAGLGATLAVQKDFGYFEAIANLGYLHQSGAVYENMDYRKQLPFSIGAKFDVSPQLAVNAELSGRRTLPLNRHQNPTELYAGLNYRLAGGMNVSGGAAVGALNGVSSQDYRVIAGLRMNLGEPAGSQNSDQITLTQASDESSLPTSAPTSGDLDAGLEIDHEVLFAHDSSRLLPGARQILTQVASLMKEYSRKLAQAAAPQDSPQSSKESERTVFVIEGHANELGSESYNLALSARRAASVKEFLVHAGISESDLELAAYGESRPKSKNRRMSRLDWLKINRRVEIRAQSN